MRKRYGGLIGVLAAISLSAAPTAGAATEFGDSCVADEEFSSPVTFFEASAPGNPLPVSAPSAGVVTQWKVNVIGGVPFTFPQTFKILRLDQAASSAQVIAEETRALGSGPNAFDTRISVQAGDRPSLFGEGAVETLTCTSPGEVNQIGGFAGNGGGVGSSNPYIELPEEFRVPVAAVLEPDADNDGYGDETQDKCPQSAATQEECPVIVVDTVPLARKGKVIVLVGASSASAVTVTGRAKLPKGKKTARSSAQARLRKVTKQVTPGKFARFVLNFPRNLKKALTALPRRKKVTLRLEASTTDIAGRVSRDRTKLRLKGQKKRKRALKRKPKKARDRPR